jgi:glutathione synthase/RimK-type ligase-like ATP-grasp enzyme
MTRVLIPTYLKDIHATVVGEGLRALGHEAVLWHGADFPTRQVASMSLAPDGEVSWEVSGSELNLSSAEPFDVVWFRRPVFDPVLPEDMHPGDREVAARECREFSRGLWNFVSPSAFWVNPPGIRQRATVKALQLSEAAALGLKIPPTLISNDPERIRGFLERYPGEAIYKPFLAALWTAEETASYLFTSDVTVDDLPEDEVLRLTAGIFQQRIPKACELRITYMGDFAVPAKLLSQQVEVSKADWRAAMLNLPIEPTEISADLDRRCRALMRRLGLVFGCFDFIVTPQGEPVFMEINEMGQFLWIEEINPEIKMLDSFCKFLIHGRPDFHWSSTRDALTYLEFRDPGLRRQEEHDAVVHVSRPAIWAVDDCADGKTVG